MTDPTPDTLTFSVNTEVDPLTNVVCIFVQETSREPGVNLRIAFDAQAVTPAYLMTVVDALPTVIDNYVDDVVDQLDSEGLI